MNKENIIKELNFKATRSSGAGGQHVNKTSSKIELSFDLANSNCDLDILSSAFLKSELVLLILSIAPDKFLFKSADVADVPTANPVLIKSRPPLNFLSFSNAGRLRLELRIQI